MLDDADERWVAEHGYFAANPLIDEAEHAIELLRGNPELGVRFRGARGRQPDTQRRKNDGQKDSLPKAESPDRTRSGRGDAKRRMTERSEGRRTRYRRRRVRTGREADGATRSGA